MKHWCPVRTTAAPSVSVIGWVCAQVCPRRSAAGTAAQDSERKARRLNELLGRGLRVHGRCATADVGASAVVGIRGIAPMDPEMAPARGPGVNFAMG